MNFKEAEAAVRHLFNEEWNGATPVAWPDVPFTPPNSTWVRFSMRHNDGYQSSIGAPGANNHRRVGIITIQVFQKKGQGSLDARTKADLAADIFLTKRLPGFTFSRTNAKDIGIDDAGWYQYNVTTEFQYDRIT